MEINQFLPRSALTLTQVIIEEFVVSRTPTVLSIRLKVTVSPLAKVASTISSVEANSFAASVSEMITSEFGLSARGSTAFLASYSLA